MDEGGSGSTEEDWNFIWNLEVPNKVRSFPLRVGRNILPTKSFLFQRHVAPDDLCPICRVVKETSFHFSTRCEASREVCGLTGFVSAICEAPQQNNFQWLGHLAGTLPRDDFRLFAIILRALWLRRNQKLFNHKDWNAAEVYATAKSLLVELTAIGKTHDTPPRTSAAVQWTPPQPDSILINVDGGFNNDRLECKTAMVARNFKGECMWWIKKTRGGMIQPLEVEALAILDALQVAIAKKWSSVTIQGDCLSVIKSMQSNVDNFSTIGAVIAECKVVARNLPSVSFSFIKRDGNCLAHAIVKGNSPDCVGAITLPVEFQNII